MNLFDFISEAAVSALGWTLLHSLWQGALIALCVLLFLPKMKEAKHRYVFAYSALLAMFLSSIYTFFMVYTPETHSVEAGMSDVVYFFEGKGRGVSGQGSAGLFSSLQGQFSAWVEANSSALLLAWSLGFAFFMLKMIGGLWYLRQIRNTGLEAMPEQWVHRLKLLKTKAKVSQAIRFMQSPKITTPLAMGYWKPMILFPIGLVNQLTPEQVEAALAHELAHIIRQDFALNVFQTLLEAVFYYHPAAWYLGKTVREEREHCCDDKAMELCGSPLTYAKTLIEIETMQKQHLAPQLAMAMAGPNRKKQKPKLLYRVQRILNQSHQRNTQIMEKSVATLVLLFCLAAWSMRAEPTESLFKNLEKLAKKAGLKADRSEEPMAFLPDFVAKADTSEPKTHTTRTEKRIEKFKKDDGENEFEMTMANGEVNEIIVNGETIPKERYGEYADDIQYFMERSSESANKGSQKRVIVIDSDEDMEWEEGDDAEERIVRKEVRIINSEDASGNRVRIVQKGDKNENEVIVINDDEEGESTVRVTTKTDGDGNSVVVINNGDKATNIKVVDGKVFMDGKEIKDGQSMDVPGGAKKQRMIFMDEDNDENTFEYDEDGEHHVIVLDGRDMEGLEGRLEELTEELGDRAEEIKARVREAMEDADENVRRIEVRMEEIEDEIEERIERRMEERETRRGGMDVDAIPNDGDLPVVFRQRLIADGLIGEDDDFSVKLTGKEMKLNRKKQPETVFNSYMDLYEQLKGKRLGEKEAVKINHETN